MTTISHHLRLKLPIYLIMSANLLNSLLHASLVVPKEIPAATHPSLLCNPSTNLKLLMNELHHGLEVSTPTPRLNHKLHLSFSHW